LAHLLQRPDVAQRETSRWRARRCAHPRLLRARGAV